MCRMTQWKKWAALAFLPIGSLIPTASAQVIPNADLAAFTYHNCLSSEFRKLSRIDLEDGASAPLLKIKDEDVFRFIKTQCDASRVALLSSTSEREKAVAMFDGIDEEYQKVVTNLLQKVRPALSETVRTINTQGPREAVPLVEARVMADDYPPSALRNDEQGTSMATYTIGVDGRVSDCIAVGATEALNAATCRIIQRRSKYAPALDENNQPVVERRSRSYTFSIKSMLP